MKRMLIYPLILCLFFTKESNHAIAAMQEQALIGSAVQSFQSKNTLEFGLDKDQYILVEYTLFDENEEDDNDDSPARKKPILSRFSSLLNEIYYSGSLANPGKNYPRTCQQFYSHSYDRYIFQRVLRV